MQTADTVYLQTSKGRTNHPVTKLYPPEVVAADPGLREQIVDSEPPQRLAPSRSQWIVAHRAKDCIVDWTQQLHPPPPPEDV